MTTTIWWQIWRVYPAEKGHTTETLGWIHRMGQASPGPGAVGDVRLWAESFDGSARVHATPSARHEKSTTAVGLAHALWGDKIGFDTIVDTEFE